MASRASEYTYHYAAVRLRIEGSGALKLRLIGQSDVKQNVLVPLTMQNPAGDMKTKGANFKQERAQLEFKTTEIDEHFELSRIIFFVKPISTSNPG